MAKNNSSETWVDKQVFTTGEAAEICKVSQQTIIRCFDNGRLQGFRVPGSRFRRIPRAELLRFMKANEIPTDILESGKKRILVVDDNRDSAMTLAMLLKVTGNDTRTAHDGMEAIEQAEAYRPAVILLDIGLPKMNGYDACRRIRAQPWGEDILMVALTGWGQAEDRANPRRPASTATWSSPWNMPP